MQLVKTGLAKHGSAFFANEQTAGKGQRTKSWQSANGQNIILSVIIQPEKLLVAEQFYLNIIAALAAEDLFNKNATENFKIKWPNDIYWNDRKTGGILIETTIALNMVKYAVIGLGLNINQTQFDVALKNPASLKQITGKNYDVIELAKELCVNLQEKYNRFIQGNKYGLLNEYNDHLYKKNETVKLKKGSRIFEAEIKKVDASGKLVVQTSIEEEFEFGSIEWQIPHS